MLFGKKVVARGSHEAARVEVGVALASMLKVLQFGEHLLHESYENLNQSTLLFPTLNKAQSFTNFF